MVSARTKRPGPVSWLIEQWWTWCILAPALVVWGAYAINEYQWRMDFVPDDLRPTGIDYAKQKSWGFGPGGYDYAVVVYPMPEETARQIAEEGVAFFARGENVVLRKGRFATSFVDWKETPLTVERHTYDGKPPTQVYLGIDRIDYDERTPFPAWVTELFDRTVREPGSYYAKGRLGYAIVSPKERKIIYFHAG